MEVLAEVLNRDQARSMEGDLIKHRTDYKLSALEKDNSSIEEQLEKTRPNNKNNECIDDNWTTDDKTKTLNPFKYLKDKKT